MISTLAVLGFALFLVAELSTHGPRGVMELGYSSRIPRSNVLASDGSVLFHEDQAGFSTLQGCVVRRTHQIGRFR